MNVHFKRLPSTFQNRCGEAGGRSIPPVLQQLCQIVLEVQEQRLRIPVCNSGKVAGVHPVLMVVEAFRERARQVIATCRPSAARQQLVLERELALLDHRRRLADLAAEDQNRPPRSVPLWLHGY
jgi:hypothetical protein